MASTSMAADEELPSVKRSKRTLPEGGIPVSPPKSPLDQFFETNLAIEQSPDHEAAVRRPQKEAAIAKLKRLLALNKKLTGKDNAQALFPDGVSEKDIMAELDSRISSDLRIWRKGLKLDWDSAVVVRSSLGSELPAAASAHHLNVMMPWTMSGLGPEYIAEKQALYRSMVGPDSGPAPVEQSSRLARFDTKYEQPPELGGERSENRETIENIHQARCELLTQSCTLVYGSAAGGNGEVVAMTGPSGYKLRAPYLTVRKPRTEQDDVTDDEELERDAVTVKTEDEERGAEEETYGPGAGDKAYVEYTKNPGFWEPGSAACVDSERNLVWACGDARIKAFSFTSPELPCKYTLQMGADPSSVTVLKDKVYACSGQTVKYWTVAELKEHEKDVGSGELTEYQYGGGSLSKKERRKFEESYENRLESSMLDESDVYDVEVTRGQRAHGSITLDVPLDRLLALPDSVAGFSGAVAATRKGGYSLYVCDLERGAIRTRLFGHLGQVEQMSASEQLPNMLASASWDTCTKIWDLRTNGAVCTLKERSGDTQRGVALVAATGGYPFCFSGGLNQSVLAWDLRMLRSLYELSTGNNHVAALYWSEPAKSLLAITTCPHIDDHGGGEDYEDVIDEEDSREPYRWPKQAKHGVKDFAARWDAGNHVLIRYAFTRSPSQKVPQAAQPYPNRSDSWF